MYFGHLSVELLLCTRYCGRWEYKDDSAWFLRRSGRSGRGSTVTVLQPVLYQSYMPEGVNGGLLFHIGCLGRAPLKRWHVSRAGMLRGVPGDRAPGRGSGKYKCPQVQMPLGGNHFASTKGSREATVARGQ